jgi:tetrahydromethanopterin S-methyltransferase subunit G
MTESHYNYKPESAFEGYVAAKLETIDHRLADINDRLNQINGRIRKNEGDIRTIRTAGALLGAIGGIIVSVVIKFMPWR